MGALPKRKVSKGRRNRRRAHDALQRPQLVECPSCKEMMRPHRVCLNCGSYNGRTVFEMED